MPDIVATVNLSASCPGRYDAVVSGVSIENAVIRNAPSFTWTGDGYALDVRTDAANTGNIKVINTDCNGSEVYSNPAYQQLYPSVYIFPSPNGVTFTGSLIHLELTQNPTTQDITVEARIDDCQVFPTTHKPCNGYVIWQTKSGTQVCVRPTAQTHVYTLTCKAEQGGTIVNFTLTVNVGVGDMQQCENCPNPFGSEGIPGGGSSGGGTGGSGGSGVIYGCTDPNALNYNPNATVDDGSCIYRSPNGGGNFPRPSPRYSGVDILHNRKGFFLAAPTSGGLRVYTAPNAFTRLNTGFVIDTDKHANLPCLNSVEDAQGMSCLYRRGTGKAADASANTPADPFFWLRRYSTDEGKTWLSTAGTGGKETILLMGKAWARELHGTHRSRESWLFYNDGSGKGTDGQPDGTGLLVVDITDAVGKRIGTFPADGKGILGKKADNAQFGVQMIRGDSNDDLRVWFLSGGALLGAASVDEGRTWVQIPQIL